MAQPFLFRDLSSCLTGPDYPLPSPVIVKNTQDQEGIRRDPQVVMLMSNEIPVDILWTFDGSIVGDLSSPASYASKQLHPCSATYADAALLSQMAPSVPKSWAQWSRS